MPCSISPPTNGPRSLLSLRIAVVATVVALPFGIAVAWLLARKDFWGKALLDGLVHLPLVLPPVVTGYLLLISFGRRGPVGAFLADNFGIVFSFRWTGAALACGVMGFPLLVRAIRLSIEAIDRRLEDAGRDARRQPVLACSSPSRCRWRCPASSPAWCCASPRRSANSAPPSPSSPTSPARRRPSRPRSTPIAGARRRRAAARLVDRRDRHFAGRAGRVRMARAPRRRALPRGLTMLAVDVEKRLGDFTHRGEFEAPAA